MFDWDPNYIFNVPLHFLKIALFLFIYRLFACTLLYGIKYSYLIIYAQLYGFKYSYLITIYAQ